MSGPTEAVGTVRFLDGGGAPGATVGGKGAQLDELVAGGFAVPRTAVVTTATYRDVVERSDRLRCLVDRLEALAEPAPSDAEIDEALAEPVPSDAEIDEAFLAEPLGERLRSELLDAARQVAGGGRLAVRSSATVEDLGDASFAGQYRSLLDVEPDEALLDAVRLVWASLWHAAPRAYRRHLISTTATRPEMGVVLMAMVPAVSAGVAFTVDPGGRPGAMRIEAVDGLGEDLVSGRRTPRAVVVARSGSDQPEEPLGAVRDQALAAERWFGRPQDVEWAWDGATVWLVQARAITTAPQRSTDDGSGRRFTTAGIGEMVPGVLPPLVWSVAGDALEEAFRTLFADLGALGTDLSEQRFVARIRGRAVLDVDTLAEVARALPGGSPELLEQQLFGSDEPAPDADEGHDGSWRGLVHAGRVMRSRQRARSEVATCVAATGRLLDGLGPVGRLDPDELLTLRARVLDLTVRTMVAEVAVAASAVAAHGVVERLLARYLGPDDARRWARRVTTPRLAGVAAVARELHRRFERTGIDPSTLGRSWAEARTAALRAGGESAVEAVDDLLRRSGSRAVVGGPTWEEEPDALWAVVVGARADPVGPPADESLAALIGMLTGRPGWRRTRVLTGQLVDVRRHIVERHVNDAVELLSEREAAKSAVLTLGGVVRRIHLALGDRLVADGVTEHPADVDLLTGSELVAAVRGRAPERSVLGERRDELDRWRSEPPLPLGFRGEPSPVVDVAPGGRRFDGWAAGSGCFTGSVVVLDEPVTDGIDDGTVLVASATDASWLPVFLACGAVVVERGGPLSHAAIVARELGLPAVTNVPGVVAATRGRDVTATVDGDRGVVVLHDDRCETSARSEEAAP